VRCVIVDISCTTETRNSPGRSGPSLCQVGPRALPAGSPNLNAYAERWVRSIKEECLSKVILFSERSLRRALSDYVEHFHAERNHHWKGNVLPFPRDVHRHCEGPERCRERLGGLLRYYYQEAA
jgi:putative transposase